MQDVNFCLKIKTWPSGTAIWECVCEPPAPGGTALVAGDCVGPDSCFSVSALAVGADLCNCIVQGAHPQVQTETEGHVYDLGEHGELGQCSCDSEHGGAPESEVGLRRVATTGDARGWVEGSRRERA